MESWIALLSNASGAAVLAFMLIAGSVALWKRWIVLGWQYDEVKADNKALREDAKTTTTTTADLVKTLTAQTEAFTGLTDELRRGGEGGRR